MPFCSMHRFLRFELLILASFSQKKFCLMHASNLLQNIRFPAGWMFLFEATPNHFFDQSPAHQKMEHCNDGSRFVFPCCPLETFSSRGEVKLGYGLETFITKSPIFGAIGIRTFPTGHKWMLSAMLVFLFAQFFVGFVIGSINRCQWSSQSARRRRLVDQ